MIQSNSLRQNDRLSPFWALSAPSSAGFFLPLNQSTIGLTMYSYSAASGQMSTFRSLPQNESGSMLKCSSMPLRIPSLNA